MHTPSLAAVAIAAATLFTPSAHAAAVPHFSGIIDIVFSGDFPEAVRSDKPLFDSIVFDGPAFAPTTSTIDDVEDQFGGTLVQLPANDGPRQGWLCYDAGTIRTWFYTGDVDANGKSIVNIIAEETIAADPPDSGCTDLTAALVPTAETLPGVGATLADLVARYGTLTPDKNGHLNVTFMGDAGRVQNVFYIVRNGIVTSVAFSAWTIAEGDTL